MLNSDLTGSQIAIRIANSRRAVVGATINKEFKPQDAEVLVDSGADGTDRQRGKPVNTATK